MPTRLRGRADLGELSAGEFLAGSKPSSRITTVTIHRLSGSRTGEKRIGAQMADLKLSEDVTFAARYAERAQFSGETASAKRWRKPRSGWTNTGASRPVSHIVKAMAPAAAARVTGWMRARD